MCAKMNLFMLCFIFGLALPIVTANIAEWDETWLKRAEEARQSFHDSYTPNPENVTNALNKAVHETFQSNLMQGSNSTRRSLGSKKYKGPCIATNPIDRCWRCDRNWVYNRKRLADCAMGFGANAKGGKDGAFYVVSDPSDDDVLHPKPGTLRHAVIQNRPLWIIFKRSMVIKLQQELIMTSHKTIDGRGAKIFIKGGSGIMMQFVKNIIIHGIYMKNIVPGSGGLIASSVDHFGYRQPSDGDGIQVFGSTNIWIDHVSMKNCYDGMIDVVSQSTAVTISNSHFTDHNHVMLMGASDSSPEDKKMQVTIAFNHFGKRLNERMPRCRFGFFHIINNDYTHWQNYAIGGSSNPTIISQGNRFIAPINPIFREVTKRLYSSEDEWKHWVWRSEGDLLMNGGVFTESGDDSAWISKHQDLVRADRMIPAPGTKVTLITRFSGVIGCKFGRRC